MLRNRYGIVGIEIILEIACDDVFGQSGGSIRIGALNVVEGANGRQPDCRAGSLNTTPFNRAKRCQSCRAYSPFRGVWLRPCAPVTLKAAPRVKGRHNTLRP